MAVTPTTRQKLNNTKRPLKPGGTRSVTSTQSTCKSISNYNPHKVKNQTGSSSRQDSTISHATSSAAIPKAALRETIRNDPNLTTHRKKAYLALLSIPEGRWTTYTALAEYLGSGPRAVGNANRTNPFAPGVPCHRVVAADRTIGKFQGDWPTNGGKYQVEKRKLLEAEGIVFDEKGRAYGECFRDFDNVGN
jgi:methylated-DNA-[protein]-cysteine S-methyltransferase